MARSREEYLIAEAKRRLLPKNRWVKAKYDAKRRFSGPKPFTLSLEEYTAIISNPCRYCGRDISGESGSGLDRLDNERGYEPGNVSPCCKDCNQRRSKSMSADEFEYQSRINGYRIDNK